MVRKYEKLEVLFTIIFISAFVNSSCSRPGDGTEIPLPIYSWLNRNIFQPKCVSCHTTGNAAYGVDLSSYSQTIATGSSIAGDPSKSTLYIQTQAGLMPKSGVPLSASENKAISDWIK